jgi:hypothetical protein
MEGISIYPDYNAITKKWGSVVCQAGKVRFVRFAPEMGV